MEKILPNVDFRAFFTVFFQVFHVFTTPFTIGCTVALTAHSSAVPPAIIGLSGIFIAL